MEKRTLGRTGKRLSVIGFGGIVLKNTSPEEAEAYVGRAINRGITYFDVAPAYGDAEERLGPALEPYRDEVFLACKTGQRSAQGASEELHNSLQLLRTDYLDLYQMHAVSSVEEAENILAPGGALETFIQARDKGLIHHIGFSAHSEEAALHLLQGFDFDSVLLPINLFCWRDGNFGPHVCKKATETGTGILALKALAKRPVRDNEQKKWPKCWYVPIDDVREARAALSFTLSKSVTAAVAPGHAELLEMACDAADTLDDPNAEKPAETNLEGEPIFTNYTDSQ